MQVLEEWTVTSTATNLGRVYNYGLSLINQRVPNASTNYFISDGHGSTRALMDIGGNVVNTFAYDAYGTLIASNGLSQTAYLYCGQQYDSDLGMYLNRARYLNTGTGRFWTMDTYEGKTEDPLSIHKYNYCELDPINGIDPSGHIKISPSIMRFFAKFTSIDLAIRILVGIRVGDVLGDAYREEVNSSSKVFINQWIGRTSDDDLPPAGWDTDFRQKPDILDLDNKTIYEIKPNSDVMIALGKIQLGGYLDTLSRRYPGLQINPGNWQPRRPSYQTIGLPGISNLGFAINITAENVGNGIIAYDISPDPEVIAALVSVPVRVAAAKTADIVKEQVEEFASILLDAIAF